MSAPLVADIDDPPCCRYECPPCRRYRGSYMSAHALLILLNELMRRDKMRGLQTFYLFFATSLINSIKQEHDCQILFIV